MRSIRKSLLVLYCTPALLSTTSLLRAEDWSQWRGSTRNGISLESAWNASTPRKVWQASIGQGYASVMVARGKAYCVGNNGSQDTVFCFDANTGKPLWKYSYSCGAGDYEGPRATPVLDGNRVYTLSREGHAICLDANTGKPFWNKQLAQMVKAPQPTWGFAGSVLIDGNTAYYNVNGAGTAVDKNTGHVLWTSEIAEAGYSSPNIYTIGGQRVLVMMTGYGLVGVNPANGRKLWSYAWDTSYKVNAADPIAVGDSLFISSGYEKGCALINIVAGKPRLAYQSHNMRNHFHTCSLVDGYLYGNDQGNLKCIELKTGKQMWRQGGLGMGGLIVADKKLIVLTERGELTVVATNPSRYQEISRAKILDGSCWTDPVLANGKIYARSHEGTLICMDVKRR